MRTLVLADVRGGLERLAAGWPARCDMAGLARRGKPAGLAGCALSMHGFDDRILATIQAADGGLRGSRHAAVARLPVAVRGLLEACEELEIIGNRWGVIVPCVLHGPIFRNCTWRGDSDGNQRISVW